MAATMKATILAASMIFCFIAILIEPGAGIFGGGYGGGHHGIGLSHLALLGAANLSALCVLKGGSCTVPGSCISNLHHVGHGGGYGSHSFNQFLCNSTTICCQPFKVVTLRKVIYPSKRRGYGRRRSRGRGGYSKRRGYGRRW